MKASKLTHMPHQIAERERLEALKVRRRGEPEAHDCAACGLVGAGCFGFGGLPTSDHALWSCDDADCRQRVEAMAAERDQPRANSAQSAEPDLFTRSAA